MEDRQLIEPRRSTAEPLVEISINADGADGAFVPSGRKSRGMPSEDEEGNALPYADGLVGFFALTETETVAFYQAISRLNGHPNNYGTDPALNEAAAADGWPEWRQLGDPGGWRAWFERYRAAHPVPTSFAELPAGHPASNYAVATTATR